MLRGASPGLDWINHGTCDQFPCARSAAGGSPARFDRVVLGEPTALCRAHAVAHVGQVEGGVGVAVDGEPHAVSLGPQDVLVA